MEPNIGKKHLRQVDRIRKNVEDASQSNQKNVERFIALKSFVFKSTISKNDRSVLSENDLPIVEMNTVEAYISRLRGEFSDHVPEVEVRAENDDVSYHQVNLVEGNVRSIFCGSDYEHEIANPVFNDTLAGGFSVLKITTEYENENSMNQVIRFEKVNDPELCGFDPLARKPSKEDGDFCYQLVPKYEHEIQAEYPHLDLSKVKKNPMVSDGQFRWAYSDEISNANIYYIADFYEKKNTYEIMYLVTDPQNADNAKSMWKSDYDQLIENWDSIQEPPQIIKKARRKKTKIMRYKFVENILIDTPEETEFFDLPLIFVDGNSAYINGKQITRPYIYNAIDSQRIKNLSASCIVRDLENYRATDVLIANEAWPENEEFAQAWKNPQDTKAAFVYNHISASGEQLPPPSIFPRTAVNSAFFQVNEMQNGTMQNILGSYDAQQGISRKDMSGRAIIAGSIQSNNAARPYVMNYMASLNQVAKIIVNLIPKYYKTLRTLPFVGKDGKRSYVKINDSSEENPIMMDYGNHDLKVSLKSGPNFDVQKNEALEKIISLMGVAETFKAMIESKGLPILIDNIDIRGQEQLKQLSEEFMKELEKKSAEQKNPQQQIMQNQLMIENKKLQLQAQKQQGDLIIQHEKLKQEQMKMAEEAMQMRTNALVRLEEAQNEADRTAAELAIKQSDHQLKIAEHNFEMIEKGIIMTTKV